MYKIDVIDNKTSYYADDKTLEYIRFLSDGRTVICDKLHAEGILSNDKSTIYQFNSLVNKHTGYMTCVLNNVNTDDILNLIISNTITMESNIDYLMLLTDADSATEEDE